MAENPMKAIRDSILRDYRELVTPELMEAMMSWGDEIPDPTPAEVTPAEVTPEPTPDPTEVTPEPTPDPTEVTPEVTPPTEEGE